MVNLTKLQETISHRLTVFGVPHHLIKPFGALVVKWVQCSGVEWTVKRLKSLKVDLYRVRSHLPTLTWCKKNSKGDFAGVIGSLFRWASKSDRNYQSVVHTLMVYSVFENRKLSESQKTKFVEAVTATTSTVDKSFYEDFAVFMKAKHRVPQSLVKSSQTLMEFRGSPSKRAPIFNRSSQSQRGAGLASAHYFDDSPYHYGLFKKYKSLYGPVMSHISTCDYDELFRSVRSRFMAASPWTEGIWGGEVHFLQEPGLKLRAIASPYLVHQLALKPLGDSLYSHLRTLPWDCTHDHKKPISALQNHLRSNGTVHSVDLSNATDYFPLKCQLVCLRTLFGHHPSIDLFEEISRSQWKSSIGTIVWTQGQPLGLYPSFASFALTHGYLLMFLLASRCKPYEGQFFVLGDDVVILDNDLHKDYRLYMKLLGCPISNEKSISSASLCEFAGKVITSTTVVPSYKWREVSNDNFIDLVRNYGRKAVSLLTRPQKLVIEKIQHCVEPFGLNWSFPGSNLEAMVELTSSIYKPVERAEQSMTGLFSTLITNYYGCTDHHLRSTVNVEELVEKMGTFDEKVTATLTKFLPQDWVEALERFNLYGGYSGVPRVLGNTDLPPETLAPSRVTTLDWYRHILNL